MPQKKNSEPPPPVMTWGKALPVIIISFIFDSLRLMFEMFWFFAPALAALYCTIKTSDVLGTTIGGFICTVGSGVVGFYGAPAIAAFGVVMAIAVGLFGWLTVGLIIVMTNARIFTSNAANTLWFASSLLVSEVPIIGALPALTSTMFKMYSVQIRSDKAALKAYEEEQQAERLRGQKQEASQVMQQQAETMQAEQQVDESAEQETEVVVASKEKEIPKPRPAPERTFPPPELASVPNYSGTPQRDALSELNDRPMRSREENIKLVKAREVMERGSLENKETDPVLRAAYVRAQRGEKVFDGTYANRNGFKFSNIS